MLSSTRLLNVYGEEAVAEQLVATAERLERIAELVAKWLGATPNAKVDVYFVSIFRFGHYDIVNGYPVISLPYDHVYLGDHRPIPECGPGFAFFYAHAFVPGIRGALRAGVCLHILQQVEGLAGYPYLGEEPFAALASSVAAAELQPSDLGLSAIDKRLAESRHYGDRLRPYLLAAATYAEVLVEHYGVNRVRQLFLGAHKDRKLLDELLALEAVWMARISRDRAVAAPGEVLPSPTLA